MKLSVPFIPEPAYINFLKTHRQFLASIYFPPASGPVCDARVRSADSRKPNTIPLKKALMPLAGIKKYILLNTRFISPACYTDTRLLRSILDEIKALHQAVGIQGIVISDFYLVNALAGTGHDIIPLLEAVPGVNSMMDSPDKVSAYLDVLERTRFRPPGRLLADRSLNRSPEMLGRMARSVKKQIPGIHMELLANEGCIFQCPFKPAHDAHIALSNTGLVNEATCALNRSVGCHDYFFSRPWRLFKSPFIRPEDQSHYRETADALKICGRTLGPRFLERCISAYINNTFDGNLIDIMDAPAFLADRFHISNKALGPDFFNTLTTCTKACKQCSICDELFKKAAYEKSVSFKFYKDT